MRLTILAPTLSLVAFAGPSALAQDAADTALDPAGAIRGFLTDTERLGAETATVGAVTADGNVVNASDVAMSWSVTFEADDDTVTVTASATLDRVRVTGLSRTDSGYSAEAVSIPEANLVINVEGADDPLTYDFTMRDYRLVEAEWQPFPVIEADPLRPVSRFAPLVDWAIYQSYALNEIGSIDGTVVTDDDRQEIAYGPLSFGPVENGALDSFSYGPVETRQEIDGPAVEGDDGPATMTLRYGEVRGETLDTRPLATLLTGTGGSDSPQTVLGSMIVDGVSAEQDGLFSMDIGSHRIENVVVNAPAEPLMERFDGIVLAALADEEPAPESVIPLALDLYGAFGVGHYGFSDIAISAPSFTAQMGEFVMSGLSAAGLDLFAVRDTMVSTPAGSGSLGAFEIADFVFPEEGDIFAAAMDSVREGEADPRSVLDASPYIGRLTVSDLEATTPFTGPVSLGLFQTRLEEFIAPVPTQVSLVLDRLSVPADAVPDPLMARAAKALGADPVTADASVDVFWEEATETISLDLDMAMNRIAAVAAEGAAGGIPRTILENPTRAQDALATAVLQRMRVTFDDAGVVDYVMTMMANQSGASRDEIAQGIVQQIRMQGEMMTGGDPVVADIADAVSAFLADPGTLSVTMAPTDPVPFAQIIGAALTSPQALPGLLNFSIEATE